MGELKSASKLSHNNTHNKRNLNLSQISNLLYNFMRLYMIITPTNYLLLSLSLSLSLFKKFGYVIFTKDSANCKPSSLSSTSLAHQTLSLSLNKRRDYLKEEEEDPNCTILKSSPTSSSSSMSFAASSYPLYQAPSPPRKRNRKAQTETGRQTDRALVKRKEVQGKP
jgi:hypothetical protein